MAEVSAGLVKELRERTMAGISDCKKALVECDADITRAAEFLRKKGLASAAKKAGRRTAEGITQSYLHAGGKIGVLVEINCETDFVAKTDQFLTFTNDVAMQVAAMAPQYLTADDVPEAVTAKEREVLMAAAKESGKPDNVIGKVVDGQIAKWYKEICLLDQAFVKENKKSVRDLLNGLISTIGENVQIRRFVRWEVGEDI